MGRRQDAGGGESNKPGMRIGIVADDLTGAADAVAAFARRGFVARVAFAAHGHVSGVDFGRADAVAVTAGTRDDTRANDALRTGITRRLTRHLRCASPDLVYLKLDSTLRGRLRLELDAARAELPGRTALVCPAFPANGRAVREGVLFVHGVSWARTDFAPPGLPDLATVRDAFGMGEDVAGTLSLEVARRGAGAARAEIERLSAAGVTTVFADAETPDDLRALACVVLQEPGRFLPVGSAGWTAAFADALPAPGGGPFDTMPLERDLRARPVVVAVGSRHPVTLRQAAYLRARIADGRVQVVQARPGGEAPDLRRFGDRVVSLARNAGAGALVLTGGETAMGVLPCFGAEALDVRGEIAPGVALASLRCRGAHTGLTWDGLTVVLKAGGFGGDATLARCVGRAGRPPSRERGEPLTG